MTNVNKLCPVCMLESRKSAYRPMRKAFKQNHFVKPLLRVELHKACRKLRQSEVVTAVVIRRRDQKD